MKDSTKQFKTQTSQFAEVLSKNKILRDLLDIQSVGKQAFDHLHNRLGRMPTRTNSSAENTLEEIWEYRSRQTILSLSSANADRIIKSARKKVV